jgi:hypothetical protein
LNGAPQEGIGEAMRLRAFGWSLALAVVLGLLLTPRLWSGARLFSLLPALPAVPPLPVVLNVVLAVLLSLAVVIAAALPRTRWPLWAALALAGLLVLFDLNRLQPWLYLYLLVIAGLLLPRPRCRWGVCAMVLVATYFWSGLQKANLVFGHLIFPWLVEPLGPVGERLTPLWWLAPAAEILVAVMLVLPRLRSYGVVLAFALHGLILFLLGPLGHNHNVIVWPWNLWMMAAVAILFWKSETPIFPAAVSTGTGKAMALLLTIAPILSFAGLGNENLSFALYSGTVREAVVVIAPHAVSPAVREALGDLLVEEEGVYRVDVAEWAMEEMNVPPFPSVRGFRRAADALVALGVEPEEIALFVAGRPRPGDTTRTFTRLAYP